jgi:probable HAF family extracellular repeat protein
MHARSTLATLMVLAMVAMAPTAIIRAAGPTVTITDLGQPGFGTHARGVNATGLAVGYGDDTAVSFGFFEDAAPLFVPLPGGSDDIQALAVNDAGVMTGRYVDADGLNQAYRYDSVGNVLTSVPLLAGALSNTATAINASGVVAGFTAGGKFHGFRQSGADPAEDIGDLGGGISNATGINGSNVVVGYATDAQHHQQAVRYDGALHALTSLGGLNAQANGINESGIVVGWSQDGSTPQKTLATRWANDTTPQSLGTLGGAMSQALAVNGNGDIVGWSVTSSGQFHAFLWQNGTMTDLNDLLSSGSGWVLYQAYALNTNGVIVGDGTFDDGTGPQARAFRMTIKSEDKADTTAPAIAWVHASPDTLWPPNNQMVPVTLTASATDDSGVAPSCSLVGMASSDPHAGDMVQTGPMSAWLRASKTNGGERRYTLTVQCTDAAGNMSTATVTVRVPKSANGK